MAMEVTADDYGDGDVTTIITPMTSMTLMDDSDDDDAVDR